MSERRRRFRRFRRRLGKHAVALAGSPLLKALAATWRTEVLAPEHLAAAEARGRGHFMALWHGRMLLGLPHHAPCGWTVLVSPSGDGDVSEALLARFGYRVLRGSSSRTGARALREMLRVLAPGTAIVLTPDGPRGPRHSMNLGAAWLARATGAPVVPIGCVCDRAWRMRSWDAFTIPKPRARVVLCYGEPVHVPREVDAAGLDAATATIRARILAAERRGFVHLGRAPDWDLRELEEAAGGAPGAPAAPDGPAPPRSADPLEPARATPRGDGPGRGPR